MVYTMREQECMAVLIAKIGTIFVPRTFCRIAAFYSKDHCRARKHASTMDGTALQRRLLWPGPAGTALRRSLL